MAALPILLFLNISGQRNYSTGMSLFTFLEPTWA